MKKYYMQGNHWADPSPLNVSNFDDAINYAHKFYFPRRRAVMLIVTSAESVELRYDGNKISVFYKEE